MSKLPCIKPINPVKPQYCTSSQISEAFFKWVKYPGIITIITIMIMIMMMIMEMIIMMIIIIIIIIIIIVSIYTLSDLGNSSNLIG